MLEEGPRYDWLDDQTIATFTALVTAGGSIFFWRAFTAHEPIVELRAFKDRNFAFGSAFSFVMGIGLYGLTYLYPVYLGQVRGYDALMIGETMFVTGVAMFLTAPLSGRLVQVLDPRVMMLIGFVGFGAGTWWASSITSDWDFNELLVPQILRGCSLDDLHGSDQQLVARHAAAGSAQERVGPVQSDAQPGRRRWPRPHQHAVEQAPRPASRPPSRAGLDGVARWRRTRSRA